MTWILYGDRGSGSAPVEMAMAELGLTPELRAVPLASDAQLDPVYRRVNPMGRVPALVRPDGTVLTESMAILVALADMHPEAGLLPEPEDPARGVALRWMALLAGEFYPHVTRADYPERFSADPAHAPAIKARAREMGREIWRVLEQHAAPAPHVLGPRFSVADLYIAALSRWMGGAEWIPVHCPRIEALTRAVAARPRAGPVFARHFGDRG